MKTVMIENKKYVIIPHEEYERLAHIAKLPAMPEPDERGYYPAVETARISLARKLILRRLAAGLSQRQLARLAGVRFETICRIETGKVSPMVATVDKLYAALTAYTSGGKKG